MIPKSGGFQTCFAKESSNLPDLRSLSLAVLLFVLILGLAGCSDSSKKEDAKDAAPAANKLENSGQSADSAAKLEATSDSFRKFNISTQADHEFPELAHLKLSYDGKVVAAPDDRFRETALDKAVADFPVPGCETVNLEVFTGGANCCLGYYIMTSCPDGDYLGQIEPFDGTIEKSSLPGTILINDPAFAYYGVKVDSVELDLPRVYSPKPQRLLVFENGEWRADKPGEFVDHYRALSEKVWDHYDKGTPAAAIVKAYYAYMAGDGKEQVQSVLQSELPAEFSALNDAIFADIDKAAGNLDLVKMVHIR